MIRAGFETTHPLSGIRTRLIAGAEETGGRGWIIEVRTPSGAASYLPEHFHLTWSETFEILEGEARCALDGVAHALRAGESITFPPRMRHLHPTNAGAGELVYRQTSDFGGVDPGAVHDVIGVAATLNGLARDGKVNARGLPRNPLQLAATVRALRRHGGFDATTPAGAQRAIGATLGRRSAIAGRIRVTCVVQIRIAL